MGHGCWHFPHKGDLVYQRSTELKCLAGKIGQKEENGAWLLVLPPQGGLGFPEVHGAEVPGSGDRTEGKEWGMAAGTPPQGGLGFPKVHRAEMPGSGDRTEGREWGMAAGTPPTRGTWFPRGPRS